MAKEPVVSAEAKALRLLALIAIKDMKMKDQVNYLARAGFGRSEIAELLGTTANSVSVRLAELKASPRNKKAPGGGDRG